jgi:hypothetical protein
MKLQTIKLNVASGNPRYYNISGRSIVLTACPYSLLVSFDSQNYFPMSVGQLFVGQFEKVWLSSADTFSGEASATIVFGDFIIQDCRSLLGGSALTTFPAQSTYMTNSTLVIGAGSSTPFTIAPAAPTATTYRWHKQFKLCNPHATLSAYIIDSSSNNICRIAPGASETFETGGSIGGDIWTVSNPGGSVMTVGLFRTFYNNTVSLSQIASL